jgi:tetratricopeptide (TPR) repeat protein
MSFLRKLFENKKPAENSRGVNSQPSQADPANDPNMIKVYDGYGREMFITKQQWKDNVLLDNLEQKRDDPDELYGMLVGALEDGFAADIVPYAEHLWRTDPVPSRGTTILGIIYMENNRLDDAERIFRDFLSANGDDGVVLTNMAKVFSRRGDNAQAESILWHALEVDPNQDNGLDWYAAIHRERGGEACAVDAYRRVAALPQSWRAQLWLARDALEGRDLATAKTLYAEALSRSGSPPPSDLLMQMSGDLGNNGYLAEIIQLVEPYFEPAIHGLQVGNNLMKANSDLGHIDRARHILGQLYAQKRHDWQETLRYWDTELTSADLARREKLSPEQLSVALMSVEGPLWMRDGSPFSALLSAKSDHAQTIVILGSTVVLANVPQKPVAQLSDTPGRISRAIPLIFAEGIHLSSDAIGVALIPWAQNQGFAVFGRPYEDNDLCSLATKSDRPPDFLIGVTLDATQSKWNLLLRLVRIADCVRVAEEQVEGDPQNPGLAAESLVRKMLQPLARHAGVHIQPAPPWYYAPIGQDFFDYLLRLEQQLAVTCMHLDFLKGGGLSGEHEILDGILQLCVRQPANQLVRMIFAQTLRQMQKVRPEILSEFREKVDLLQRDHPLEGVVGELIKKTIAQVMAGNT